MQINELLTAIRNGNYDQNLDGIRHAIIDRQKAKAPKAYEFHPGQRVFFNSKVRPQYLQGVAATVVKINQVKIVVDLERPAGRYYKGVTVPTTLIAAAPQA